MIRMPLIPSLALLLLGTHMVLGTHRVKDPSSSQPALGTRESLAPEMIALPPSEELMALEIEALRAERGSVLAGSLMADAEIAPAKLIRDEEAVALVPEVRPQATSQQLAEQLRRTARELQAFADRLEASSSDDSPKK